MTTITNPIANIPMNVKSHSLGWAQLWANQLGATINHKCDSGIHDHETVYIDHGVNFHGALNMFGGANEEVFNRINNVLSHPNVVSLDWDMPDYGALFKKRLSAKTTHSGITEEWCDKASERISRITTLRQQDVEGTGVTLGDSHSIAFAAAGDVVLRNDGATLFGALNKGLETMMRGVVPKGPITLCFGSIDIRHHVLRHDTDIDKLVDEYVWQGTDLATTYGVPVHYAAPVPVEYEGRRIPQTGYFDKTPFYGSQLERAVATDDFVAALRKQGVTVVQPPQDWYDMDPEAYAKNIMEFGGSFHVAPPYYRRNNWGRNNVLI